jgi:hypothetical protein
MFFPVLPFFSISSHLVHPSFLISSLWPLKIHLQIAKAIWKMFQTNNFTLLFFLSFPGREVWSFHFCFLLLKLRSLLRKNISLVLSLRENHFNFSSDTYRRWKIISLLLSLRENHFNFSSDTYGRWKIICVQYLFYVSWSVLHFKNTTTNNLTTKSAACHHDKLISN